MRESNVPVNVPKSVENSREVKHISGGIPPAARLVKREKLHPSSVALVRLG